MNRASRWALYLVGGLALAKVALALGGVAAWGAGWTRAPENGVPWPNLGLLASFLAGGLWLVVGSRDLRAQALGVSFALIAAAFSDRILSVLAVSPAWSPAARACLALQTAAWLPATTACFFADFPRAPDRPARRGWLAAVVALSAMLFVANFLSHVDTAAGLAPLLHRLSSRVPNSWFWPLVLMPPAVGLARVVLRGRAAGPEERRRVESLLGGLIVGVLPVVLVVVLSELVPGLRRFIVRPDVFPWMQAAVLVPLATVPFSTAYAVQVHRALDVRRIAWRAAQYALARYTLITLISIPAVLIGLVVYANREARVIDLVTGGPAPWLLLLALVSGAALVMRQRALEAVDRRFYRERLPAEEVLSDLIRACRQVRTVAQLDHLVASELDRVLHVSSAVVLSLDQARGQYRAVFDRVPPLPQSSLLADLLARGEPIDLTSPDRNAAQPHWTGADRDWAGAAGARLLVPLLGGAGDLLGLVAVGEKRSELPFDGQDRSLLTVLGATVAASIESHLRGPVTGPTDPPPARECLACSRILPAREERCPGCGQAPGEAEVPLVLSGKYRLLCRIGAGGMGIVYRAVDENLGREVVIKALPRVAGVLAPRLRREARAMASVSHPNLATLFGLETWRERPLLVLEYLPNGTLTDRLAAGPLPIREVLEMGYQLADGLAHLHLAGVLHRDIKPSNIGFTRDGRPKLLDFGLAKLGELVSSAAVAPRPAGARSQESDSTTSGMVVGTLPYMSYEAVHGLAPEPSFDTWSLSVTLFQALTGINPFAGATPVATLARLAATAAPDLRHHLAQCPEAVALVFDALLAPDPLARPRNAESLKERLGVAMQSS